MIQLTRAGRVGRRLGTRWLSSSSRSGNSGGDRDGPKNPNNVPKSPASTATPASLPDPGANEEYKGRVPRPRDKSITNLDVPRPDLLPPVYKLTERASHYQTEMTTLDDGLRVASQTRYGNYSTVGVAISAGSRFEAQFPSGINHIIEKLGFAASRKFENRTKLIKLLEEYGGVCDCQITRDTTIFAISAENRGLKKIVELLGDAVLHPLITDDDLASARQSVLFEKEDMELRPEKEPVLVEMCHATGYGNTTLGSPRQCPDENLYKIDRDAILKYLQTYYTPGRMVVSGVGVDHKELVDLSKEYLKGAEAVWNVEELKDKSIIKPDTTVAKYIGGFNKEERDFGAFNAGPLPVPSLAHIVLSLESVSHKDPEFVTACVLNILMGGGGSFSAGGPGKGMYSRLYVNILNQYHWAYNATAFNTSYSDTGMFNIYACSPPEHIRSLVLVCLQELASMAGKITPQEVNRSKTQLHSMLLMNLETRPIVFEDIGRQILSNGYYKTPDEYIKDILSITGEDIQRLAWKLLDSKLSLTGLGNLHMLPHYEEVTGTLNELLKEVQKRNRLSPKKS